MLTMSLGIAQLRACLEWSESAIAMLSAAEASPASNPTQENSLTAKNNP
jgi:hypothetical protein